MSTAINAPVISQTDAAASQQTGAKVASGPLTVEAISRAISSPTAKGRAMRRHGLHPHDVIPPRSRYFAAGRFGRMFGELPPFASDTPQVRHALLKIGEAGGLMDANDDLSQGPRQLITDQNLQINNPDNPRMGAGMTFLGQFLDHDMTFDPTSSLERQVDPEQIANFRTPTFALDSVYGAGIGGSPHLYEFGGGPKFLVEKIEGAGMPDRYDLPRNSQEIALSGDPRNDENLVISQLHLAFLRFHNAVVDHLAALGIADSDLFAEAQRTVRWHYQWIILKHFLRLTCTAPVVEDILANGRKLYDWQNEPYIPVEFSVACYRFGHSQVRPSYRANFTGASGGGELFQFIFQGLPDHTSPEADDFSGSSRKPWRFIDWRTFFDFGDGKMRHNKKIDTKLSTPLFVLPGSVVSNPDAKINPQSLAQRNLLRHLTFSLPSGQRIGKAMKAQIPSLELLADSDLAELKAYGLHNRTPLWYYVLKEAEVIAGGESLGPLGARIVAEVFVGLIQGDSQSFLTQDPDWTPFLPTIDPAREGHDFTMEDMLRFAGVA
jgi:hypothetical protein